MKVGDFIRYDDGVHLENMVITNVFDDNVSKYKCLTIEALNDVSKPFINTATQLVGGCSVKLITDEKEIHRLNKLMVFK